MFVPSQVSRTIIGSNTYANAQQRIHQNPPPPAPAPVTISAPPIPAPTFISTFGPSSFHDHNIPEKSYSTEPTPVVLSSAPKLYTNRPTVTSKIDIPSVPQVAPVSYFITVNISLNWSLWHSTDWHQFDTIWSNIENKETQIRKIRTKSNCRGCNTSCTCIVSTSVIRSRKVA